MLRVAAIQALPASRTLDELYDGVDVDHAITLLDAAAAAGAMVACFPELYPAVGEQAVAAAAARLGIYVICGLLQKDGARQFNTATLIDCAGRVVGRQAKLLPTQIEMDRGTSPGRGFSVFRTPIGNMGLVVCADLPWSNAVEELVRGGADVIFNPSWWFAIGEAYPSTVISRHLEFGVPVIVVNMATHALADESGVLFPAAGGHSTVTTTPPVRDLGELAAWFTTKEHGPNAAADFATSLGDDEGMLLVDIDIDAVRTFPGYFFAGSATAEISRARERSRGAEAGPPPTD